MEIMQEWLVNVAMPGLGAALLVALFSLVRELARQIKDERLRKALEVLVQAAEQLYGSGQGAAKRRFVQMKMQEQGLQSLGPEALEAAVFQLKDKRNGTPAPSH